MTYEQAYALTCKVIAGEDGWTVGCCATKLADEVEKYTGQHEVTKFMVAIYEPGSATDKHREPIELIARLPPLLMKLCAEKKDDV